MVRAQEVKRIQSVPLVIGQFNEAIEVDGIFLTKLDGTARGGIVVAIWDELRIPVKLVGLGERPEDLAAFEPEVFVEAMFAEGDEPV